MVHLEYDASGNLWLDGNNKVAYKINALGLPERVARYNGYLPADLSYADFMDDKDYEGEGGNGGPGGEWATVGFKYDDGGNRIFERSVTRGAFEYGRLTVPGVGMFERERNTAYDLKRMDLVDGGFRLGLNGDALFPLSDAQGNVRGYVSHSGWIGMHAYYPFGSVYDIHNDAGEDKRRWQSKEYDGEHGKYYFGARYFDPFFALWMSPDPAGVFFRVTLARLKSRSFIEKDILRLSDGEAVLPKRSFGVSGQFANPYTYGGDPVNFADPNGMWSLGLGFVFGWDSERGWHVGFGIAADLTDAKGDGFGFNLSYTWNDDGFNSFNIGSNAGFWFAYVNLNAGLSYSYNTYSGSVLSASGGVCFGVKDAACAGVEAGGSLYWDRSGDFMGGTAFAGAYAEVAGGLARVSGGYEMGLLGMEGRGVYAGGTVAGLHGEWSHRDGASWGWSRQADIGRYDSETGWHFSNTAKAIGGVFALDMNQSILAMSWQLVSRFTWELPQTVLGLGLGVLASESGIVGEVDYERGATILRYNVDVGGAFTIGSFIAGSGRDLYRGRLLEHEYGHTIQSRLVGPLYLPFWALPSLIDCAFNKKHRNMEIEKSADELSKWYGF